MAVMFATKDEKLVEETKETAALPIIRKKRQRGKGNISSSGYVMFHLAGKVKKFEHVMIVEKALGKPLPKGAEVHHVDENRLNNSPSNLVLCPSRAYHKLLHRRMIALKECGHADWIKCHFCKKHGPKSDFYINSKGHGVHPECVRTYQRNRYRQLVGRI